MNFTPFPDLITERLQLRRPVKNDMNDLYTLRCNAAIMRYIPRPLALSPEDALVLIERMNNGIEQGSSINWAVTLKSRDQLIGVIGYVKINEENFRAEVGYILHPDFHGKGMMSEALGAVVDYGFKEMKLHTIEAVIHPDNRASCNIIQRNGFMKEAHFKDFQYFEGKFQDAFVFSKISPY